MLGKVISVANCNIELAKNSLCNLHDFSPILCFEQTPKSPRDKEDQPPALTSKLRNKIIAKNLQALHQAREAYVSSENSEMIRRAISYNICTSHDIKYLTIDHVYFKRVSCREWHVYATVRMGNKPLLKWVVIMP